LDLSFDLNLNLNLDLALNRVLFPKPLRKTFATSNPSSVGSLYGSKNPSLKSLANLAAYHRTQPGERPLGRPLHGRIVALVQDYTIPCGRRTSS